MGGILSDLADLYPGFAAHWIDTSIGKIFARAGGSGPPLLLLHGYPGEQRDVASRGAGARGRFTLVIPDLPGYGWSVAPEADAEHAPYTKRAMAAVMVEAMEKLGHVRFRLAGHDRGGRVAYRLALDHPGRVEKIAVLDIVPTYDMWHGMDRNMAMKVWHWPFLAQPYPLPEMLIAKAPVEYLEWKMASWTKAKDLSAFDPRALDHYRAAFFRSDPHPRKLRGLPRRARRRSRPRRGRPGRGQEDHLPARGVLGRGRHPERERVRSRPGANGQPTCTGRPIDSGHFVCEENPRKRAAALLEFFAG